jgi:zinc protease
MGFLEDIQKMPELYEFSRQFHERYYRPEYTTLIVAGDVEAGAVRQLVEEYWGEWKRGSFVDEVPQEGPLGGPVELQVPWPSPTMPLLQVAYRGPAYADDRKDSAAVDLLSYLYFSETSELYEKLVLKEQSCDVFSGFNADHVDPYLYVVTARVKEASAVERVKASVAATVERMKAEVVEGRKLERVKKHLRYGLAMQMSETEAVASLLARYVAMRRSPETMNRLYEQYDALTPADLLAAAREYFVEANRVSVLLEGVA